MVGLERAGRSNCVIDVLCFPGTFFFGPFGLFYATITGGVVMLGIEFLLFILGFLTLSVVLFYPLWFAYITLHLRFVLLTDALIILTTVVLYVLACDPLPPCASRVREWFRGTAPAQISSVSNRPYARARRKHRSVEAA